MSTAQKQKTYLYDGVYASGDGMQIKLEADGNVVYLEWRAFQLLLEYAEKHFGVKITVETA